MSRSSWRASSRSIWRRPRRSTRPCAPATVAGGDPGAPRPTVRRVHAGSRTPARSSGARSTWTCWRRRCASRRPATSRHDLTELAEHHSCVPTATPGRLGFRHAHHLRRDLRPPAAPRRRELHRRTAEAAAGADRTRHARVPGDAFRARRPSPRRPMPRPSRARLRPRRSHPIARRATCMPSAVGPRRPTSRRSRAPRCSRRSARAAPPTDHNEEAAAAFEAARSRLRRSGRWTRGGRRRRAPLVAARHLLGDDLAGADRRILDALCRPSTRTGRATRPARRGGRSRSDRVRARLLAALAAAYMLDRRLDIAIDLRPRGATAGRARGRRPDRAERHDHAGRVPRVRRTDGRGLAAARADGRGVARGRLGSRSRPRVPDAGHRARPCCSSTTAASGGCATASPTPSAWSNGTIATTWPRTSRHVLWATGRWDEALALATATSPTAGRGHHARHRVVRPGLRGPGPGRHDPGDAAPREALELGDADARAPAHVAGDSGAWRSSRCQRADPGPPSRSPRTASRPRPRSATRPISSRSPSPGRGPTSMPATRSGPPAGSSGSSRRSSSRDPGGTRLATPMPALVAAAKGGRSRPRRLEAAIAGWDRARPGLGGGLGSDRPRTLPPSVQPTPVTRIVLRGRCPGDRRAGWVPRRSSAAADAILLRGRRPAPARAWAPLTAREFEVAQLVARG